MRTYRVLCLLSLLSFTMFQCAPAYALTEEQVYGKLFGVCAEYAVDRAGMDLKSIKAVHPNDIAVDTEVFYDMFGSAAHTILYMKLTVYGTSHDCFATLSPSHKRYWIASDFMQLKIFTMTGVDIAGVTGL